MSSEDTRGDEEARERSRRGRVTGSLLALLLVLVVAAGGALWWMNRDTAAPEGDVPLVKADATPTKTKPDDPGGMPVPNRDKLVYQLMSPNPPPPPQETLVPAAPPPAAEDEKPAEEAEPAEAEAKPEPEPERKPAPTTAAGVRELLNLPPPPEAPKRALDRGPDAPAEPVNPVVTARLDPPPGVREAPPREAAAPEDAMPETANEAAAPTETENPAEAEKPAEAGQPAEPEPKAEAAAAKEEPKPDAVQAKPAEPSAKPETPAAPKEVAKAQPPAPAPPAPAPQLTLSTADAFRIQLAAFRDENTAESEWKRLQRTHAKALGDLSPFVETVDLGAKGLFHRLQAGPLPDRAAAAAACAQLKAAKQDCIIVPPK